MKLLSKFSFSILFVLFIFFNKAAAQDWNMLWSYDISSAGEGQAGSETDGMYLYTSFYNSGNFAKFDLNGNWIETFTIDGAASIKDLAYDGEFFYGSNTELSGTIFKMNFNSQTLEGTIPVANNRIRHIAYDSDLDQFWCGNLQSDIICVSRTGAITNTIPFSSHKMMGIYGSAYDNVSEGGPYLWVHSQSCLGTTDGIAQVSIATGTQTGVWHNVMTDAGSGVVNALAGGLFNSLDVVAGNLVLGGVVQGTPTKFFAYSLMQVGSTPPNLVAPANKLFEVNVLPLFQWTDETAAISYNIQVSAVSNFSETIIDVNGITSLSYQAVAPLEQLSGYYWRVRGLNASGSYSAWSKKYNFTTQGTFPQPTLLSPVNDLEGTPLSLAFTWERHIAASNYHFQVSQTENFSEIAIDEPLLIRNKYVAEGLEMGRQYWWRVQMFNPNNNSPWSEVRTFTTSNFIQIGTGTNYNTTSGFPTGYGNYYNGAKQQFLIRANDINNAGGVSGLIQSLSFNVAVLNSGQPLEDYEIKIKKTNLNEFGTQWDLENFTSVYYSESYQPTLGWNIHQFTEPFYWDGMSNIIVEICFNNSSSKSSNESTYWTNSGYLSTMYFRGNNNPTLCSQPLWASTSQYRPNMKFSIDLLDIYPPKLTLPLNKSICASTTPLIEWEETANAINYTLQIALEENFSTIIFEAVSDGASFQLPIDSALNELTKYYWRVNATDGTNISYWSQIWQFVTEGDLSAPELITPADSSSETAPTLNFSWEANSFAKSYELQIATDEEFENIVQDLNVTTNQAVVFNLSLNTQYYWRLQAINDCSTSPYSEVWSFTTGNTPFVYGYNNTNRNGLLPGPVTFSLGTPSNMFFLAQQQSMNQIHSGTWANGIWYGIDQWSKELLSFNTSTGERTIIGNLGAEMTGISFDVQTETMYGVAKVNGVCQLYTIDFVSGTATNVGPVGNIDVNNLGCSTDGDLYAVCPADDNFYYIDKYTGIPTLIGPTGINAEGEQDIEFDIENNICYWAGYINYNGYLLTINTETGAATQIGMFPQGLSLTALSIPYTPACLDFPELVAPSNKSVCNVLLPSFNWNDVENALNYTFQLATSRDFDSILYNTEGLNISELTLPDSIILENQTQYFWRVRAIGADDCNSLWSSKYSFVTDGELSQLVLLSPANNTADAMLSPLLTWTANVGAENYYLQISGTEDFSEIVIDMPNITKPSYSDAELNTNTQYWWRVKMSNSCSESEWSEVFTFTTVSHIVIGTQTLTDETLSPYRLADGSCITKFLITANELTAGGGIIAPLSSLAFNVSSYNSDSAAQGLTIRLKHTLINNIFQDATLEGYTTVYGPVDYVPVVGWNEHTFDVPFVWDGVSNILVFVCFNNTNPGPENAMVYYSPTSGLFSCNHSENGNINLCAAENINSWGASNRRANLRFGIDLSGFTAPELLIPENASNCNSINPFFDWSDISTAISYTYQLAASSDFGSPIYQNAELTSSELQLPEDIILDNNTMYFWRVNAFNGEKTSTWSNTFSFITEGNTLPVPTLIVPENNVENYLTSFEFQWTGNFAASGYHLQVAEDETFENIIINQGNLSQTNYLAGGFAFNSQYYWRVMMVNSCSESEWSDVRTFTTGSNFVAGNGNSYNGEWNYPAPYGASNAGAKQHYLIRAEELINSGISAGTLTSVAFNVAVLRSGFALENYTISLKHTTMTEFTYESQWDLTGWNLVYGPVDYVPQLGWNTHLFDYNFIWDGVSNILVDICFNNYNSSFQNESTYWTETPFNSACSYTQFQNDVVCTEPQYKNINNMRPNMVFGIEPEGIQSPRLLNPLNNANNFIVTPLFDWAEVTGSTSYNLQVATNPDFTSVVIEQEITDGSSYQIPSESPLEEMTIYYWRVNSSDEENTSTWSNPWVFRTIAATPTLLLPANGENNVQVQTVFDWNDVAPNLSYKIQISNDINFESVIADEIVQNSDFALNLDYNSSYYWRVRVYSDGLLSDWSEVWSFNTESVSQLISLNSGWHMISSFIEPVNDTIPNVFSDLVSNLKIVKNGFGQMYDPAFNINTIGNWNYADGYLVNMLNEDVLVITGQKLVPEETPINLNNGWNLSAYLRDNDIAPTAALASISSSLVLAKDNVGGIFMPSFGINTIGNMQSGQGYYFYMNEAAELTYPANSAQKAVTGNNITPLAKYNIPTIGNTGSNATLLISIENNEGNEIGVYNMNNELIGAGAIHNGIAAITIWGDDEATQNVDGAKENEYLNVKLYNTTNNTSKEISLTQIKEITGNTEQNELYYRTNAIYVAKASTNNESGFAMSIKNIPNPVESNVVFEFTLTDEANAEIQIYTSTGELIASIGNKIYSAGIHRIDFDASNLANGMYNIVLSSGERRVTSFMIVSK